MFNKWVNCLTLQRKGSDVKHGGWIQAAQQGDITLVDAKKFQKVLRSPSGLGEVLIWTALVCAVHVSRRPPPSGV